METAFLTITIYGMVSRLKGLQEPEWDFVILDEALLRLDLGTERKRR